MGVKGAILGDIAGSQYEFNHMRPKDLDWKNVPLFTEKCRRTDDSILTLATKGAILEGERKGKEPDFTKVVKPQSCLANLTLYPFKPIANLLVPS